MRVGDLVAVYHHVPRHEAGNVPVGLIGKGIVIEINKIAIGPPITIPIVPVKNMASAFQPKNYR